MRAEATLPELVHIPAGPFLMGDDYGSREARPAHEVTLPEFWIGRYPVTALEYAAYVSSARRSVPRFWPDPVRWLEQGNDPVGGVSWREAQAYCGWLSECTGYQVRLPTEAEWEKAATWDAATGSK